MSRTLKIFFIVLGLSIFILPQQMIYAQSTSECCDQKSTKDHCSTTEKTESCHSDNSNHQSKKKQLRRRLHAMSFLHCSFCNEFFLSRFEL